MELRRHRASSCVRTEGGLLPSDLLAKIAAGDRDVPGLAEADFGLASSDRVREAITRSWNRLVGSWAALAAARVGATDEHDPLTTPTRERWLLPLFEGLGFGRLTTARSVDIEGTAYPISHAWEHVPIHLVGFGIELDRRTPGVRGAAGAAPHALVQEYLNRSDAALWGIVSNGRSLRLLRDSTSLTRQAFVEFDLEAIFEGELYADFALLWAVCHRTRFAGTKPEECLLEQWTKKAADDGTRALEELRGGVERAIETLGAGFLAHPSNGALREALRSGELDRQDYYRELLRLVYRLIFLFTAEDRRDEGTGRELLLDPGALDEAADRYRRFYSTARLRSLAGRRRGTRHPDLWAGLRRVIAALGGDGASTLALPALGSFLFGPTACPHLDTADLRNEDLLDAVRALATIEEDRRLRLVDYRNLGAEELGGVYEGLLELHPRIEVDATPPRFTLGTAVGNERKATGSYYTPTSLITCLLDSALDPVVDEAVRGKSPEAAERAILELAVVDPAAGSGHFLVAAAHRLAKRLAAIRSGEGEPAPAVVRHALRDVIAHCIYAVDLNPMAVELCKVGLWLEAVEPGKPLSFLDAHVRCGNSLLGTAPELLAAGIPDAAYEATTGDDQAVARAWRDRNRRERGGQQALFEARLEIPTGALARETRSLDSLPDETAEALAVKAARHAVYVASADYRRARAALDAWCTAFVAPQTQGAPEITTATVRAIGTPATTVTPAVRDLVASAAAEYVFFHWPVEFPVIHERGGFDVVLGNPPWDQLEVLDPEDNEEQSRVHRLQRFFSGCGMYPLTGSGRRNMYALFAERTIGLVEPTGRVGLVLPTGVVTDHPNEKLCRYTVEDGRLVSLYDFENQGRFFPAVHRQQRFCLLTAGGAAQPSRPARYGFLLDSLADAQDDSRCWKMDAAAIRQMSPARFAVPTFRNAADARIAHVAYSNGVTLWELADQGVVRSGLLLNYDRWSDGKVLSDESAATPLVPVYEGEFFHSYDHRFAAWDGASVVRVEDAQRTALRDGVLTRWAYPKEMAERRWSELGWHLGPYVALRRQASTTNETTAIAAVLPPSVAEGSVSVFFGPGAEGKGAALLCAALNSFVFNFLVRLRQSGANVSKSVYEQVPVPVAVAAALVKDDLDDPSLEEAIQLALELIYAAPDLAGFAQAAACNRAPYAWNPTRRQELRVRIEAMLFRWYGLADDVLPVMESFPILQRREIARHGDYRLARGIVRALEEIPAAKQPTHRTNIPSPPYAHDDPPSSPATERTVRADPPAQQTLTVATSHAALGVWQHELEVDSKNITMGMRVRHRSYGTGTVLSVKHHRKGAELLIRFDVSGEKWIAFGYGVLEFARDADARGDPA
jgi:hypothetical protein